MHIAHSKIAALNIFTKRFFISVLSQKKAIFHTLPLQCIYSTARTTYVIMMMMIMVMFAAIVAVVLVMIKQQLCIDTCGRSACQASMCAR
jgi:hypothetical protein